MAKQARSARGDLVDFDILSIRQALASAPISVGAEERRQFIDTKNGIKPKVVSGSIQNGLKAMPGEIMAPPVVEIPEAMRFAIDAATIAQSDIDVVEETSAEE